MGYVFEWDPKKAKSNARKHGVTFEEASTVLGDLLALQMPDPDHSLDEERYVVLGRSTRQRILVMSYAERPPRTRLISARQATREERRQYEEES
ncbi:MAG: BrnT family toxin [Acidobacteria bacterium]|nr:BrnT family toxin [Acidobacteriota bacterium]MCI0717705.1 BrnT family toxin [Acidobacteriota bacterium]